MEEPCFWVTQDEGRRLGAPERRQGQGCGRSPHPKGLALRLPEWRVTPALYGMVRGQKREQLPSLKVTLHPSNRGTAV